MNFSGSYLVIERDDSVLIPGKVPDNDFSAVTVILGAGVTPEDINSDDVGLMMSQDNSKLRFERCEPEQLFEMENADWMPVGYAMVRYYPTWEAYQASENEMNQMESIKLTTHESKIMDKYRTEILNLLLAESEAMDKADGKSVEATKVKSDTAPAGGEKETKIKLTGGGDDVGGKLPATPPSGKVPGGEDGIESPDGKGVAKEGGSTETSTGGKGEKMKPEGTAISDASAKPTKDLPKNPNIAKEGKSFVLPHDIMVEHDGKVTKLSAGTTVTLVSEAKCEDEKCKDEKCSVHGKVACEAKAKDDHKKKADSATEKGLAKADKGNKKAHMKESVVAEGENPFGGESEEKEDKPEGESEDKPADDKPAEGESEEKSEEKPEGESDSEPTPPTPPSAEGEDDMGDLEGDIPEDMPLADAGTDSNIIDRLAMSVDHFAADLKEFLGVEKEEPAHQDGEPMMDMEAGEDDMFAPISDLPADAGVDDNLVTGDDLPEVGQSPNPFAR